jgi:hypothetical protein
MQNISDGGTGKTVDQRKELNNLITAGLGIHDKRHSLTLTPIMEREQYSRIVKSEDGYAAKRDSEVRAGLSLSKYGHFDAFGNEYLAWALLSWASGPATRNSRIYFRTGMDFTPKLGLEFFGEQYSYIKDSERMQSFGLAGVFKL